MALTPFSLPLQTLINEFHLASSLRFFQKLTYCVLDFSLGFFVLANSELSRLQRVTMVKHFFVPGIYSHFPFVSSFRAGAGVCQHPEKSWKLRSLSSLSAELVSYIYLILSRSHCLRNPISFSFYFKNELPMSQGFFKYTSLKTKLFFHGSLKIHEG